MTEDVSPLVARFRLIYVFNAWVLTIVAGTVLCLGWTAVAGAEAVPAWLWIATILDGTAFACYFLLSAPVAEHLGDGRSLPGPIERPIRTLERWDEAGRE